MDITCDKCKTVSSIPDAAIPDEGIHFECPSCSTQLFAKIDDLEPEEDLFGGSSLSLDTEDSDLNDDLSSLDDLGALELDLDFGGNSSLGTGMQELADDDISPSMIYNPDDIPSDENKLEIPKLERPKLDNSSQFKEKKDIATLEETAEAPVASNSLESYLSSKSASVQQEKSRMSPVLVLLILLLVSGGATGYYLFFMKNKNLKEQFVMTPEIKKILTSIAPDNPINYKKAFNEVNNKLATIPNHILYKTTYLYIAARYFISIETIIKSFAPEYNNYYKDIKKYTKKSLFIKKTVIFYNLSKELSKNKKLSTSLKTSIQQLNVNNDSDKSLLTGYIYYKNNNLKKLKALVKSSKIKEDNKIPLYYLLLKTQFSNKQNISLTLNKIQKINPNHIHSIFYNINYLLIYNQLSEAEKELKKAENIKKIMSDYELTKLLLLKAKILELKADIKNAYNNIRIAEDLKVNNDVFFKEILNFYYNNFYNSEALNMLKYAYEKKYSKDFTISKIYIKLLIRSEQFGKAGQISTHLRNKYPKKPEAYYLSALLSNSLENTSMAIDFLKKSLSLNNKYQDAIVLLSKEYIVKGQNDAARELLENAVKDFKDNDEVKKGLALFYFNEKKYKKSSKLLQELLLKTDSEINKIQIDFKLNIINLNLKKQSTKETLRNIYILYSKSPNFLGLRTEIGRLEIESKRYDKAIKILKEELRIRENNIDANLQIGIAYFLKNNYAIAEEFLNKAISLDSKRDLAFFYLGKTLRNNNKLNKSLEAFANAYSYDKNNYTYLIELARISLALNQLSEASTAYGKLLKIDPSFEALYEYGSLFLKQGNSSSAIKYYNQAYQINSKNKDLILNMGNLFFKNQKYKKAITFYKKLLKLDPKNSEAYYMLGESYRTLNKFKLAVRFYTKAIKLNPDEGKYYYQLAYLYKGMNRYRKSLRTFQIYLKKVPNSPDKGEIEDEIYDLKSMR